MPSPRLLGPLFLALGLATACSSSDDEAGASLSDSSVQAYAKAQCDLLERCSPVVIPSSFVDKAACVTSLTASLKETLVLRGVRVSSGEAEACSASLGAQACDDPSTPAACQLKGELANDQPCASGLQCSSGQCFLDSGIASATSYCGTCKAFVPEGGDCSASACEPGLGCSSANRCIRGAAAGAPCGDRFDCGGTLQCVGGTCTPPLQQGAACSPGSTTGGSCETLKNLFCVQIGPSVTSTQCQPATFAAAGQPCGFDAGKIILCGAGGDCTGIDETTGKGTCTAALAEGAACSLEAGGAACAVGLDCANGVCAKPLLATCNP